MKRYDIFGLLRQTNKVVSLYSSANKKSYDLMLQKLIDRYMLAIHLIKSSNNIQELVGMEETLCKLLMVDGKDRENIEVNYPRFIRQIERTETELNLLLHGRHYLSARVILLKEFEDEQKIIYRFGPDDEADGKLVFNKNEETISLIVPVSDCPFSERYFNKSVGRIAQLWQQNREFPDKVIFDTGY